MKKGRHSKNIPNCKQRKNIDNCLTDGITKKSWNDLSDAEKTRYFLKSERLADTRDFTIEFGSWEYPDIDNANNIKFIKNTNL